MAETSFGKYQLIELLGRGGMGEVWRAHDTVIDRTVAIKILTADISRDEVFEERFRREAQVVARLNSPHIVPIHNHGEIDGRLFVDMRLIEGRDLQSIVDNGPLSPARAVSVVEQVAKALRAAHKVGLLHRDVKPSNILIDDDDDYAYLIDFGIARTTGERGLTSRGDVIGTFHYMAPERFKAEEPGVLAIDSRSDIYALACVLYECLTAEHTFPGDSLEQQVANHLVSPPPRPSVTDPSLPSGFDAVIAKGMAKEPDDRYATATELARAARGVLTSPMALPERSLTGLEDDDSGRFFAPVSRRNTGAETVKTNLGAPPETMQTFTPDMDSVTANHSLLKAAKPPAPWWRRKGVLIPGAVLAAAAIAATGVILIGRHGGSGGGQGSPGTQGSGLAQSTLPFIGLRWPEGLTVDSVGTVYVADTQHDRILVLAAGKNTPESLQVEVPEGLSSPSGVTTDSKGAIYINDAGHNRVLRLPNGSKVATELHFAGLRHPTGLTVNGAGTVYVADSGNNRVVGLPENANDPKQQFPVAFTGLNAPTGLTIAKDETMYVADGGNHRVLLLAPGQPQREVPFKDLRDPGGVTLDGQGAVYVTDSAADEVLKLPVGAKDDKQQVVLPFTGLDYPWGLSVDSSGAVYVAGHNDKILVLRKQ